MIHIILYWILSVAQPPTFIWVAFWLHLIVSIINVSGSFLKGFSDSINPKNTSKDEDF